MSKYHSSLSKYFLDIPLSIIFLTLSLPVFILISVLSFAISGWPILFVQKRVGKNGKIFRIIKFRTMVVDAQKLQNKLLSKNEADGPVFKIYNDPRFSKIGKILSRTGMDELPQFLNILKGEMSLVGPRPLPLYEANKLTKKQKIREMVRPGIVSTWVTHGSHKLKFSEWMRLDKEYVEKGTFATDLKVIKDSAVLVVKSILNSLT